MCSPHPNKPAVWNRLVTTSRYTSMKTSTHPKQHEIIGFREYDWCNKIHSVAFPSNIPFVILACACCFCSLDALVASFAIL